MNEAFGVHKKGPGAVPGGRSPGLFPHRVRTRVGGSGLRALLVRLLRLLGISLGDFHSWGSLLEANVRPVKEWSQLHKIGARKTKVPAVHRDECFFGGAVLASAESVVGGIIAAVFKVKKEIPLKEPYL